jgi:hypothetical protein
MSNTRKRWSEDRRQFFAMLVVGCIAIGLCFLFGCTKAEPVPFVTTETPALPAECVAPATPEPKLPGQGKRDVLDDEAVRDREAMPGAYRNERLLRAACKERLQVLFPQKDGKP